MRLPPLSPLSRAPASGAPFTDGAFAVAPMMDYTNQFLRYLLRRISRRATLYTEMVTSNTLVHCPPSELPRFLEYDTEGEHPVVLQLGGSDPHQLRRACEIAREWRYDAINLNCGCPSDRVAGAGCFGAAMMRERSLVADCCAAMAEGAGGAPVTVKCRIGVADSAAEAISADEAWLYEDLARFVDTVSGRGGVTHFAVHARQAVLGGLSPDQNRKVPPLHHEIVHRLALEYPHLSFSLNGGVEDMAAAANLCGVGASASLGGGVFSGGRGGVPTGAGGGGLTGVMVGRAVVNRPWHWATVDSELYGEAEDAALSRRALLHDYVDYAARMEAAHPQRIRRLLLAPCLNLFAGEPHGKQFRGALDAMAKDESVSIGALLLGTAEATLLPETLDAPPGHVWHQHTRGYMSREASDRLRQAALAEKSQRTAFAAVVAAAGAVEADTAAGGGRVRDLP